jgi:hypothetical protein
MSSPARRSLEEERKLDYSRHSIYSDKTRVRLLLPPPEALRGAVLEIFQEQEAVGKQSEQLSCWVGRPP